MDIDDDLNEDAIASKNWNLSAAAAGANDNEEESEYHLALKTAATETLALEQQNNDFQNF